MQALEILKEPKFLEAIASISTPDKQNVPLDDAPMELDNMKHEEK